VDFNGNGVVEWWERTRLAVDVKGANSLRLQLSNLGSQMAEIDSLIRNLYGIDTTGLRKGIVLRVGLYQTTVNSIVPFRVRLAMYVATAWPEVTPTATTVTVSGTARLGIVIRAPTAPGFYSGYLVLEDVSRGTRYRVPVSYEEPLYITLVPVSYTISMPTRIDARYGARGVITFRSDVATYRRALQHSTKPSTDHLLQVRTTWCTSQL